MRGEEMTDDEIDTIWWMAGKMKPWEFRKYMRVVFAGIADTAGAKLSASNLPEEFRIKDPADYKRTMDAQFPDAVREKITRALHYPDCWDTAAYPTLDTAILESMSNFICSTCLDNLVGSTGAPSVADTAGANQEIKVAYQEGHFQGHHDGMKDAEEIFAKLSEIADEEIMARNPKSIIAVGRALLAAGASEDARDAARYRWLRNEHFPTADNPPLAQVVWKTGDRHWNQWSNLIDGNDLDRAIDDAIAKESGK